MPQTRQMYTARRARRADAGLAIARAHRGATRTAALTVIADLKGLGLRQFYMPAVWMLKGLVFIAEQNYP